MCAHVANEPASLMGCHSYSSTQKGFYSMQVCETMQIWCV